MYDDDVVLTFLIPIMIWVETYVNLFSMLLLILLFTFNLCGGVIDMVRFIDQLHACSSVLDALVLCFLIGFGVSNDINVMSN